MPTFYQVFSRILLPYVTELQAYNHLNFFVGFADLSAAIPGALNTITHSTLSEGQQG